MNRHRCECSICTERGEEIELLKQRLEFSEFEWNRATAGMQERDAEIARLQDAKRAALKLADERVIEANGLRAQLAVAMDALNKISTIAGNMQGHIADAALLRMEASK